jgi:hypothetical protein
LRRQGSLADHELYLDLVFGKSKRGDDTTTPADKAFALCIHSMHYRGPRGDYMWKATWEFTSEEQADITFAVSPCNGGALRALLIARWVVYNFALPSMRALYALTRSLATAAHTAVSTLVVSAGSALLALPRTAVSVTGAMSAATRGLLATAGTAAVRTVGHVFTSKAGAIYRLGLRVTDPGPYLSRLQLQKRSSRVSSIVYAVAPAWSSMKDHLLRYMGTLCSARHSAAEKTKFYARLLVTERDEPRHHERDALLPFTEVCKLGVRPLSDRLRWARKRRTVCALNCTYRPHHSAAAHSARRGLPGCNIGCSAKCKINADMRCEVSSFMCLVSQCNVFSLYSVRSSDHRMRYFEVTAPSYPPTPSVFLIGGRVM